VRLRDPSNPSEGWTCVESAAANPATPPSGGGGFGNGFGSGAGFCGNGGNGGNGGVGGAPAAGPGQFQVTTEHQQA
jgi:hypothetical protein